MKYVLSLTLIFLLPIMAISQWIMMSLESAVKTSDLIVIGTLHNVSEETRDGVDYGTGEITVDEVLSGRVEPDQKLSLIWQNSSDVMCPRVEHREDQNKKVGSSVAKHLNESVKLLKWNN